MTMIALRLLGRFVCRQPRFQPNREDHAPENSQGATIRSFQTEGADQRPSRRKRSRVDSGQMTDKPEAMNQVVPIGMTKGGMRGACPKTGLQDLSRQLVHHLFRGRSLAEFRIKVSSDAT